jgi:pimeloyl-ACP methyl ester carboxylesterase
VYLPIDREYTVEVTEPHRSDKRTYRSNSKADTLTIALTSSTDDSSDKTETSSLTKQQAEELARRLFKEHHAQLLETRAAEMQAKQLEIGDLKMPFAYEIFGEKPTTGRSMYISMHGGGGAPARVNTRQWENQKKLYKLQEGVYVVPRAPTDTWDLWHQAHIDRFFARLIENFIVMEDVDPNRVYIMGYSAGGDGVYQLAPRMADRFAAAAMMAGHPNETSPLGLRNLPFALHVGANDVAYNRNKIAAEWGVQLADLQKTDPTGYVHSVKIHDGKGHWMDSKDAEAIPWMAQHVRNPYPQRIVWKQDDVVSDRFYWLSVDPSKIRERALVTATREGQHFDIQSSDLDEITIRLNDAMVDFDQPIRVTSGESVLYHGLVFRSVECLKKTFEERHDPSSIFSAEVVVRLRDHK